MTLAAVLMESSDRLLSMAHLLPIVFVVDDDISVRESLELLIQNGGWQPETFETADEFLARPQVLVPSCLVLDLSLPGLNGLELQRRLVTDRPDVPIIFITGHGDVPVTVQAMKAGAVEFLTKPFSEPVLLNAIQLALERSEAALRFQADLQALEDHYASPGTRSHGPGGRRPLEQTGRLRTRHQRDNGQGSPRSGDAQDERQLLRRAGKDGRETGPVSLTYWTGLQRLFGDTFCELRVPDAACQCA
jgi:FixJ family two-component response regulator